MTDSYGLASVAEPNSHQMCCSVASGNHAFEVLGLASYPAQFRHHDTREGDAALGFTCGLGDDWVRGTDALKGGEKGTGCAGASRGLKEQEDRCSVP